MLKRKAMSQEAAKRLVDQEYNGNISLAARDLKINRRTLSRWYNGGCKKQGTNRYIVTYAQNNTLVHKGFYQSIMHYIGKWEAELICYRGRYRNPTSPDEKEEDEWWDDLVRPYLMDNERELNSNLVIYPAMTQPTAVNPLSGFDTHTGEKSGIFPHPKIRLKTVATPGHMTPKIMLTTGAITVPNYSKSKAGEKGKHHHIQGAAIVEVKDDKIFHVRHINAEADGSFFDIAGGVCKKYTPDGIEHNHHIEVLTFGDLHYPFIEWKALDGSMDLIKKIKPKTVVLHDCLDFWARNHHERGNRFLNTAKELGGDILVENEIDGLGKALIKIANPDKYETLIVPSNHDEALDKWLQEELVDKLGANAAYFHWLSYHKHKSSKRVYNGYRFMNTLEFALREKIPVDKLKIRFLERDVPEIINGVSHDMHGDIGPSGSKGSSTNLSKIGVKSTVGHYHSPSIVDGCYAVGTKSILLGYAKGPNSWLNTDCIQYTNGKRTLITCIEGEYCL